MTKQSQEYKDGAENARFQIKDLGLKGAVNYFESKTDYIIDLTSPRLIDWWTGFADVIDAAVEADKAAAVPAPSKPGYYASESKEIAYDEEELI